jgi:hypothetical protein
MPRFFSFVFGLQLTDGDLQFPPQFLILSFDHLLSHLDTRRCVHVSLSPATIWGPHLKPDILCQKSALPRAFLGHLRNHRLVCVTAFSSCLFSRHSLAPAFPNFHLLVSFVLSFFTPARLNRQFFCTFRYPRPHPNMWLSLRVCMLFVERLCLVDFNFKQLGRSSLYLLKFIKSTAS